MNSLTAMVFRSWLLPALGLGWFAMLFFHNAWLYEDAWISFRSIEQLYAGNGPVWNPDERTQVYTSVAWYWLGGLARLFTADYMLATLFLSALCCTGMLALLRRFFVDDLSWLAIVVLLTTSRGVMDFSSSGLENPLGYLLVVVVALCWREVVSSPSRGALIRLFAAAAWVPLVRHDLTLLVLPACAQALWLGRRTFSVRQWAALLCCAALPLLAWTAFALIYYGMPFPNTYYAKAAAGIPRYGLVQAGINYYWVSLFFDPVTVIVVLVGTWCLLRSRQAAIGLGLLLNLLYILWIGGDYMMTRFLTYSFVLVLACGGQNLVDGVRRNLRGWRLASVLGLLALFGTMLWLGSLQKIMLLVLIVFYRNVLWLGDGEVPGQETLTQLDMHGLLLCGLLLCLLVWLPGRRLQQRFRLSVRTVKASALVIASLAYLQFNPTAALHLAEPVKISMLSLVQIRHEIDLGKQTNPRVWLSYRQGERLLEGDYFQDQLANYIYLDSKPSAQLPGFPGHPWRTVPAYLSDKTERMIASFIGLAGFGAGTDIRIFDILGITEPYIARLKTYKFSPQAPVGHWSRAVASEYYLDNFSATAWRAGGDYKQLAQDVYLATRSEEFWARARRQAIWRLMRNNYDLPLPEPETVQTVKMPFYVFSNSDCRSCQALFSTWVSFEKQTLREMLQHNLRVRQISLVSDQAFLYGN